MRRGLILPGIGNSGPLHWQSQWQQQWPDRFDRIAHSEWDAPVAATWVRELSEYLRHGDGEVVLVAHSLACLLVALWAEQATAAERQRISGALLVAVPDPAGPSFPPEAVGFSRIPQAPLPFPSLVVFSDDDPYDPNGFGVRCAAAWGSAKTGVGSLGHINSASNLGLWPVGQRLVASLGLQLGNAEHA